MGSERVIWDRRVVGRDRRGVLFDAKNGREREVVLNGKVENFEI